MRKDKDAPSDVGFKNLEYKFVETKFIEIFRNRKVRNLRHIFQSQIPICFVLIFMNKCENKWFKVFERIKMNRHLYLHLIVDDSYNNQRAIDQKTCNIFVLNHIFTDYFK